MFENNMYKSINVINKIQQLAILENEPEIVVCKTTAICRLWLRQHEKRRLCKMRATLSPHECINTLWPKLNGLHFAEDTFKFLFKFSWIWIKFCILFPCKWFWKFRPQNDGYIVSALMCWMIFVDKKLPLSTPFNTYFGIWVKYMTSF